MNRDEKESISIPKRLMKNSRLKDILIIAGLALILIIAVWKIFYKDEKSVASVTNMSENEQKVCNLLEHIEGVGEAEVMIYESKQGIESVVVLCEGAKNLQVIMDVREAVSAALGTEQKSVKIYLKKE